MNDIQDSNNTLVVIELASNTMKKGSLKSQLLKSFQYCKHAWIIESGDLEWDIKEEFSKIDNVSVLSDLGQLDSEIRANANPKDNIVIMTNRSSLPIRELLINCLKTI